MKTPLRFALLTLAITALVSCSKKEDKGDKTDKTDKTGKTDKADKGGKADKGDKSEAPDFSAWDQAAKAKAWQGSWLVKENGTIQAWTIAGSAVTTWDGKEESKFELGIEAPCRAHFKADNGAMYPRNFTVVGGALRFRGDGGGYRKGADAIYCDASGSIFVLAGDKCTLWEKEFREWKSKPGECGIKKNDDGAEVFHHADPNGGEFAIEGDAILSRVSFETEKVDGDHAAAKAARDAKAAE